MQITNFDSVFQEAFYEQLEKHGGSAALAGTERVISDIPGRFLPATRHESIRFVLIKLSC